MQAGRHLLYSEVFRRFSLSQVFRCAMNPFERKARILFVDNAVCIFSGFVAF